MTTNSIERSRSPYSEYWAPPIAAGAAIIPTFHGFRVKSAQQLGAQIPRFRFSAAIKSGFKVSPTIGTIVGVQMAAEAFIKNHLMKGRTGFSAAFGSAAIVGFLSAAPLAAFNAQSMGKKIFQAIRGLTIRETSAITARETIFVASVGASDEMSNIMKRRFGDNKATECGGYFVSGASGSLIGHVCDTALTRWQEGLSVSINPRSLLRGAPVRAITVGAFTTLYKLGTKFLQNN